MPNLLIVDDEPDFCFALGEILKAEGFRIKSVNTGRAAVAEVEKQPPDLVLLDLELPDLKGIEVLEKIKQVDRDLPVIIITGYGKVVSAVDAIKKGAFHYLTKPFDNSELLSLIKKALETQKLSRVVAGLRQQMDLSGQKIVAESRAMINVFEQVRQIAPTELSVILYGESGTGKEVIARLIHRLSKRYEESFVAIDCGTLPEGLVESELFGYEAGAFTGADRRKLGQFEIASGGTLLLDEITNIKPEVQAKLLRVLQERKIQHLGGKKEIEIDCRILTATNLDLMDSVKSGRLREDLFHRLNEFSLYIPPLRERKEDILPLAQVFLEEGNKELKKNIRGLTKEACRIFLDYSWPGNVRELKNTVKRAVLLADSEIRPEHTQIKIAGADTSIKKAAKKAKEDIEKKLILQTLQRMKYNRTKTARVLGIDRKALYYKMKYYNL